MSALDEHKLDLTHPVELGGQSYGHLNFAPLTAGMLMDCGMPVRTISNDDGEQESVVNMKAVGRLIARSAGVPPQVVRRMEPGDFMAAMTLVMDFFPTMKRVTSGPLMPGTATETPEA